MVSAVQWSLKSFFAPNSQLFQIMLAEKREEEHKQLQSILRSTQTQY